MTSSCIYVSGMPMGMWGWNGRYEKIDDNTYGKSCHSLWGFVDSIWIRPAFIRRHKDMWEFNLDHPEGDTLTACTNHLKDISSPVGDWDLFTVSESFAPEMPWKTFAKVGLVVGIIMYALKGLIRV